MARPYQQDGAIPAIAVTASPQNVYGQVEIVTPKNAIPLQAFQGLSDTIGQISKDIDTARRKRAAADFPGYIDAYLQDADAFAEKVRSGEIPEYANPSARSWFHQLDASRRMSRFQDEAMGLADSLSPAADASGTLTAPQDFHTAIGKLWKDKYASSYVFQTPEGRTVQAATFMKVVEGAETRWAQQRLKSETALKRQEIIDQGAKILDIQDPTARSEAWSALFADAHQFGTLGIRDLQLRSLEFYAKSATNPERAMLTLARIGELKLGGTSSFNNDAEGRMMLRDLTLRLSSDALAMRRHEAQLTALETNKTVNDFSKNWFGKLYAARDNPIEFDKVVKEAEMSISLQGSQYQESLSDWLRNTQSGFSQRAHAEGAALHQAIVDWLDTGAEPEAMRKVRNDNAARLSSEQQDDLDRRFLFRETNQDIYTSKPYLEGKKATNRAVNQAFSGVNASYRQAQAMEGLADLEKTFDEGLEAQLEAAANSPDRKVKVMTWIAEQRKAMAQTIQERIKGYKESAKAIHDAIEEKLSRKLDATELNESPEAVQWLSQQERDSNARRNIRNQSLFGTVPEAQLRTDLARKIGGSAEGARWIVVSDDTLAATRDIYLAEFTKEAALIQGDEKLTPVQVEQQLKDVQQRAYTRALNEGKKLHRGQNKPLQLPVGEEAAPAEAPKTEPQKGAAAPKKEAAPAVSAGWAGHQDLMGMASQGNPHDYRVAFVNRLKPVSVGGKTLVRNEFLQDFANWTVNRQVRGATTPSAMDQSFVFYAKETMESPDLSDDERQMGVAAMLQYYGLTPRAIEEGKIEIKNSPDVEAQLRELQGYLSAGASQANAAKLLRLMDEKHNPYLQYLNRRLRNYTIDLDGISFDWGTTDFGFKNRAELDAWYADRTRRNAFLEKVGARPEEAQHVYLSQLALMQLHRRDSGPLTAPPWR